MKYETALQHFKTARAIAKAFDPPVSDAAVTPWMHKGVIPEKRAIQLEVITNGAIKVDVTCYDRRNRTAHAGEPANP